MTLPDQVRAVIADELGVPLEQVQLDSRIDSLTWDSLLLLNLMFNVEKRLGVRIRDEDLERLQTVGEIIECVRWLKSGALELDGVRIIPDSDEPKVWFDPTADARSS